MAERKDVSRTRKAVFQAYLELAKEKSMRDVTASDIIKRADISRGTFYAHYKDIQDLQNEIETDFVSLTIQANLTSIRAMKENPYKSVYMLLVYSKKNAKMIRALSANGTNESFFLRLKMSLKEELAIAEGELENQKAMDVLLLSITAMIVDNCREEALGGSDKTSLDTRAKIISALIGNTLK
jgi:AcrR family transcriptional regulator